MSTMTKRQVMAAMKAANIEGEVRGAGQDWEVELRTVKAQRAFRKAVTVPFGGYRTGYGAWVYSPNYHASGDWNNPSSRCHY